MNKPRCRRLIWLSVLISAPYFTGSAPGETLTVNSGADAGGTCPGPTCTLRQAILVAAPGDMINFAAGISTVNLTVNELLIDKNLTINGPGANLLTVQRNSASKFRIFRIALGNFNVTISGLTIANGFSFGGGGGGILNGSTGTLTVIGCTISGNRAGGFSDSGGGVYNVDVGTLTIADSTVSGNSASQNGGGIEIVGTAGSSTLNLTNSTVSGNSANTGGGIFNSNSSNNVSSTLRVNVINSTISGNAAPSGNGAGIYNSSSGSGGAEFNLTNSTVSGNSSNSSGGGVYNSFSVVNLTNCTIDGNSATSSAGGGVSNGNFGTVIITNSTVSRNSTGGFNASGGISNGSGGIVQLKNSIVAVNTNSGSSGPDVGGPFTSSGFNLIGKTDGSTGFTQPTDQTGTIASPLDPKLDPNGLQNNGGPTQTIALLPGSPAIDKGTSNGLTGTLTADQRGAGFPRKIDYPSVINAAAGDGTDIGAFEFGGPLAPISLSRKTHGTAMFDVYLPLSVPLGVECRTGNVNGDHQVILSFPSPVSVMSVSVTTGIGSVTDFIVSSSQVIVNLTGVANAQTIVLTLFGVSNGTNTSNVTVSMGVLLGDTTENGTVNASDIGQVKSKSGQPVDASNFRADVGVSGSINASDVALVKSQAGTTLPQ